MMEPIPFINHSWSYTEIDVAASVEELRQARIVLQNELQELLSASLSKVEWYQTVNELHDRISRKAVELCIQGMVEEGFGQPPVPYAFIVFGSSGREESTLWSDQDNGMIISDMPHEEKESYYAELGQRITDVLEELGYAKCEGKVMCSERLWRKTLEAWKQQLSEWRSDLAWEPVRNLIIASDMRFITGDHRLAEEWINEFYSGFRQVPELSDAVLRNTVKHKATLNILGQVVTERFGEHAGGFDVKYGLYIPLVNSARFLALQHGIKETSTLKRIERLVSLEAVPLPLLDAAGRAFVSALEFRRNTPVVLKGDLQQSSGFLDEKQMKQKQVHYELRNTLGLVRRVHRALQRQLRFAERRRP
ncbi:CBS domain-containing protein [Paenibacillus amylolyticus]|uniref:CBS domain-containing protein n=2 Tax=Paenibacillus amylolyticus TaxID=1451 RepID=A0AAP5GZB6_PAEAM|nr:CBS domain-containing protein [Paenibacillus amylolyticus]